MIPALEIRGLTKRFAGARRGAFVHAVNGVDLVIQPGETLALVGESGSGKTTIGRLALRLETPDAGSIKIDGRDVAGLPANELRRLRAVMQMVFQDPWGTLNPRLRVGRAIEEPLLLHTQLGAAERRARAEAIAAKARLASAFLDRFPNELSGGQLQRIAIARALVLAPRLVVLDEPTSSLDLSVRAEIFHLLRSLQAEVKAAYLIITHDLGTVRLIADRVAVLYLGQVMESGPARDVVERPRHPYSRALMAAELSTRPGAPRRFARIEGEPPSPLDFPQGCPFAARCAFVEERCRAARPPLEARGNRAIACWRADEPALALPEA